MWSYHGLNKIVSLTYLFPSFSMHHVYIILCEVRFLWATYGWLMAFNLLCHDCVLIFMFRSFKFNDMLGLQSILYFISCVFYIFKIFLFSLLCGLLEQFLAWHFEFPVLFVSVSLPCLIIVLGVTLYIYMTFSQSLNVIMLQICVMLPNTFYFPLYMTEILKIFLRT